MGGDFFHQLNVIDISFAKGQRAGQQDANWKEEWVLCWQPETEIQLVESALYGDTIELAAAYVLKEKLDHCTKIKEATAIIETAYKVLFEGLKLEEAIPMILSAQLKQE